MTALTPTNVRIQDIARELARQRPLSAAPQARAQHRLDCRAVADALAPLLTTAYDRRTFLYDCGAPE